MIRITIERITERKYVEVQKFVLTEKPTGFQDLSYGRPEVAYERTYENKEIPKFTTDTKEILKQELEDEGRFDFVAVVKAINGIS